MRFAMWEALLFGLTLPVSALVWAWFENDGPRRLPRRWARWRATARRRRSERELVRRTRAW